MKINGKKIKGKKSEKKAKKKLKKDNELNDTIINFGEMFVDGKKVPKGTHKKSSWW